MGWGGSSDGLGSGGWRGKNSQPLASTPGTPKSWSCPGWGPISQQQGGHQLLLEASGHVTINDWEGSVGAKSIFGRGRRVGWVDPWPYQVSAVQHGTRADGLSHLHPIGLGSVPLRGRALFLHTPVLKVALLH